MEFLKGLNIKRAVSDLTDKQRENAKYRYKIITPIVKNKRGINVPAIPKETGVPVRTIEHWLHKYRQLPVVSSLVKNDNPRNEGKIKLSDEVEDMIRKAIDNKYVTNQKGTAQDVKLEVTLGM